MRFHRDKKSKLRGTKEHHKHMHLTHGLKKYINGWLYVYCNNTNLHGFRYITIDGSTIIEGLFWFIVCMSSVVFCIILMLRVWDNYSNNPIATTIDTSNLIWDLPFPAVTICNNNKIYRSHANIIAKQLHMNGINTNMSDKFFSSLLKLIRPDKASIDEVTAKQVFDILGMSVETLMNKLMQPCSALLVRCAWVGRIYDCNKIFKTVKSKEGFCCAFNSHYGSDNENGLSDDYSHLESGDNFTNFLNFTDEDLPGVRKILNAPGSGRDVGLAVALNVDRNNYKGSVRPSIGASIFVHDAIDFPDIGAHITSVPPGHVLAISVSGTSIKSMDSLRDLPLDRRLCYFDDELSRKSHYSFQSCVSECLAKHLQEFCGCLPFYYPKLHVGVRTCYLTDVDCILARQRALGGEDVPVTETCRDCLPQCTDINYAINVEDIEMGYDVGYDSEMTHDLDLKNISLVHVFFGDTSYVEYRKGSILSWDGLLASFGGIFGLCLGGSVMSIIELFYLLTKEFVKFHKKRRQSTKNLPPASNMFLSIPAEKVQLEKPQNHQEFNDKRVYVTWYQPTLQRRRAINPEDIHSKRIKF